MVPAMNQSLPTVLTVDEAADLLRITPRKVAELARQGDIPGQKLGREWRFSRRAIEEWLQA